VTIEILTLLKPDSMISAPGFYRMPAARYHKDPVSAVSLSSSCAVTLVSETPAHAKAGHPRLTEQPDDDTNKAMDLGSVVHELVLGEGGGFRVHDFPDWRTKDAKAAAEASREVGEIPILKVKYDEACEVDASISKNLQAIGEVWNRFLAGHKEIVYIWRDIGGPWCRSMDDCLYISGDHAICFDLKTTATGLSDREIQSKIVGGMDLKAAFRVRGLTQLLPSLAGRIKFMWIFAEVNPPYEIRAIEATGEILAMGDRKAAYAIELWRRCMGANEWPGYPRKIERIPLPGWAEAQWMERELSEDQLVAASHPLSRATPIEHKSKDLEQFVP
jgi:hypothetical protein